MKIYRCYHTNLRISTCPDSYRGTNIRITYNMPYELRISTCPDSIEGRVACDRQLTTYD